MKDNLCRLLYLDTVFWAYTYSEHFSQENMENKLKKMKKESEELPLEEIKDKIANLKPDHLKWYERFENKDLTKEVVDVKNLIINHNHNNLDGIEKSEGKRMTDFLNEYKNNKMLSKRLNFVRQYLETIVKFLPVVVRQASDKMFEIAMGNHRAMAYIEKKYKKIEVLVMH